MPEASCQGESFSITLQSGHLVEVAPVVSPDDQGAQELLVQTVLSGELLGRADQGDAFALSAQASEGRALHDEGRGHDRQQVTLLGSLEHTLGRLDSL